MRNKRIRHAASLNQCCISGTDLESSLLGQTRKMFSTVSTQSEHDGRWILQVSYLNLEHREQDYSKSAGVRVDLVELSLTKKW